jgi:hypothetical protein
VEVIDAFDGDPAVFRIQGFAHLMPRLTQLAEIHVLDLRVALREDAASATARTHGRHMFDHSDETPAWESAFPAHWDRTNLKGQRVHRAIYISLDLIRFGGHLPKGGYDVQTNGRQSQAAAQAPAVRCRV